MRVPAPPADEDDSIYYRDRGDGRYYGLDMTGQFNLFAQCPALSVPAGWSKSGLPIGLQIVGRLHDEPTVLRVGALYEASERWIARWPAL